MLNDELRVNSGLTYGASSRFNALKNGSFAISTFTAKTTEPAIDKALEVQMHKMVSMKNHWLLQKIMSKDSFPTIRNYRTTSQLADTNVLVILKIFINNFEKMLMT
jgi:predicted Zn-dependent peptidase